jgi:Flp pilus assembly protein TadG
MSARLRPRNHHTDRGSSTVEFAVLVPLILMLILSGPQFGMWYVGRQAAQEAARIGARDGSVEGAAPTVAHDAALEYAQRVGGSTLNDLQVDTSGSNATEVQVVVTATIPLVMPLLGQQLTVRAQASRPRERFTKDNQP